MQHIAWLLVALTLILNPVENLEATTEGIGLPFRDIGVTLQQGWKYDFSTKAHEGIDYVKRNTKGDWISFDVFAVHEGEAKYFLQSEIGGEGWGNYVKLNTTINGKEKMYVYAHLFSSPLKTGQWTKVERGQFIGVAGDTETGLASPKSIHLHFEEWKDGTRIDPYGIYSTKTHYPNSYPGVSEFSGCGSDPSFVSCPPDFVPASALWHPAGSLVRIADQATWGVYYLQRDTKTGNLIKRWVVSKEVFDASGYELDDVIVISGTEAKCYDTGKDIDRPDPEAMKAQLVRILDDYRVYVVSENTLRWLNITPEKFSSFGYSWKRSDGTERIIGPLPPNHGIPRGKEITEKDFQTCQLAAHPTPMRKQTVFATHTSSQPLGGSLLSLPPKSVYFSGDHGEVLVAKDGTILRKTF